MAFDFPANPAIDEVYTSGGVTYVWDGETWRSMAPPLTYVMRAGDSMTGPLRLPPALPTIPEDATHKQYVDQSIAASSLYQGPWQVAANIPNLDPAVMNPLHTYSWIAQTVDKDLPEIAPPTLPGIGGLNVASGDTIVWNANTLVYDQIRAPASTAGYVPLVGGTMTGALTVQASPTNGGVALRLPNGGEPGHIAWLNGDGTRKAWLGAGSGTALTFNLDGATSLNLLGGNLFMEGAGGIHWANNTVASGVNDFSKGICLYGYGTASQFGFCITSGTLNISVQAAANKVDFNVAGTTQFRVSSGTSNMYSNFHCAGTITSGVANGGNALSLNDGARVNFSSGCLISKVHGSNQFQHHTNANQVFTFHISGTGDVYVIDTVGSTGNSYSATAPEALALGAELGVARRKPETEDASEGVDIVKMLAALLAKVKQLEADIATLKAPPRTPEPPPLPRQGRRR